MRRDRRDYSNRALSCFEQLSRPRDWEVPGLTESRLPVVVEDVPVACPRSDIQSPLGVRRLACGIEGSAASEAASEAPRLGGTGSDREPSSCCC